MKEIILRRLSLLNFKGIRKLSVNFDEHETNIYGANGSGKTTIFDALWYLFFGKDSLSRKEFNIKTLGRDGQAITRLPHEVEGVIEVNGEEITLKKVYSEKWTRKRGSAVETFNGHMVECFYNEVPCSVSEYERKVSEICDEQVFKLITNPLFFTSQKKDFQRTMLIQMAGNVSTDDIARENPELASIVDALSGKTLEEYKREVANKKRRIKDGVEMIPARIDERRRDTPQEYDWAALEAEIEENNRRIAEIEEQISDRSKAFSEITKQREALARSLSDAKSRLSARTYELRDKLLADYNDGKRAHDTAVQQVKSLQVSRRSSALTLPRLEEELVALNGKYKQLKDEWSAIIAEKFVAPTPESFVCPTCHRQLDTSDIDAEIARLRGAFEDNKTARKEANKKIGKETAGLISAKEEEIKLVKDELFKFDNEILEIQSSSAYKEEPTMPDVEPILSSCPELVALRKQIADLEEQLSAPVEAPDTSDLQKAKCVCGEAIQSARLKLRNKERIKANEDRIAELQHEYQEGQNEITRLEGVEFNIQQFAKARIEQVEGRINALFSIVRFKMYEQQINGGEIETCEATVNGVPFADLNTEKKLNAGLDIINAISKANGIVAPIFIDNRESVTEIISTAAQIINLIVAPECKTLKID